MQPVAPQSEAPRLVRGIGLGSATALNMIDMIGVGPFITLPLIVSAMGGPQAMLGWVIGAVLAMCDGLVWAELGAAMPGSGGSYRFLREIYGRNGLGRMISFLFIWQLSFSAPMSIASGAIGFAGYAAYLFKGLDTPFAVHEWALHLPLLGALQLKWLFPGRASSRWESSCSRSCCCTARSPALDGCRSRAAGGRSWHHRMDRFSPDSPTLIRRWPSVSLRKHSRFRIIFSSG